MDYYRDTREAYRNERKAREYHDQYSQGTKWARLTMWRQRVLMRRLLDRCKLVATDRVLDIPCGTGFIGRILRESPARIIASDISREMMTHALGEYEAGNFQGFVQADITQTPFRKGSMACVILLAFMHRLPTEIRRKTWEEVVDISTKFIIVSYSLDSQAQRLKQWVLKKMSRRYVPAPSPLSLRDVIAEIEGQGLVIWKTCYVVPLLSAKVMFLARKKGVAESRG